MLSYGLVTNFNKICKTVIIVEMNVIREVLVLRAVVAALVNYSVPEAEQKGLKRQNRNGKNGENGKKKLKSNYLPFFTFLWKTFVTES
jgi:hypothetical protein